MRTQDIVVTLPSDMVTALVRRAVRNDRDPDGEFRHILRRALAEPEPEVLAPPSEYATARAS